MAGDLLNVYLRGDGKVVASLHYAKVMARLTLPAASEGEAVRLLVAELRAIADELSTARPRDVGAIAIGDRVIEQGTGRAGSVINIGKVTAGPAVVVSFDDGRHQALPVSAVERVAAPAETAGSRTVEG